MHDAIVYRSTVVIWTHCITPSLLLLAIDATSSLFCSNCCCCSKSVFSSVFESSLFGKGGCNTSHSLKFLQRLTTVHRVCALVHRLFHCSLFFDVGHKQTCCPCRYTGISIILIVVQTRFNPKILQFFCKCVHFKGLLPKLNFTFITESFSWCLRQRSKLFGNNIYVISLVVGKFLLLFMDNITAP